MPAADVLEMVLAGQSAFSVAARLRHLPPEERQDVLCTACAMHDEIARNCLKIAAEASKLLTAECPYYINGVATCLLK